MPGAQSRRTDGGAAARLASRVERSARSAHAEERSAGPSAAVAPDGTTCAGLPANIGSLPAQSRQFLPWHPCVWPRRVPRTDALNHRRRRGVMRPRLVCGVAVAAVALLTLDVG